MTGEPTPFAGASHFRATWALPAVAVSPPGVPGVPAGISAGISAGLRAVRANAMFDTAFGGFPSTSQK